MHREHPRSFHDHRFVYPVLSRRSRGISIGINLNPDKVCNFGCVYCQVDRHTPAPTADREVDPGQLMAELETTIDLVRSGAIFDDSRFASVPGPLRRLNDLAFSGDGEPTTCSAFTDIVRQVVALKQRRTLDDVKLILITNATMFHRPRVREALALLDTVQGEIWAKLDAGTEVEYQRIERTRVPFSRVLSNLLHASRVRPLVIQTLFMRFDGKGLGETEIEAYCLRLEELLSAGGRLQGIQIYTVARTPSEPSVGPLPADELDRIGTIVRNRVQVPVEVFHGAAGP